MGGGGELKKKRVIKTYIIIFTVPHRNPIHTGAEYTVQEYSTRVRSYRHKQGEVTTSKPHERWPRVCTRFASECRKLPDYYLKFRGHLT